MSYLKYELKCKTISKDWLNWKLLSSKKSWYQCSFLRRFNMIMWHLLGVYVRPVVGAAAESRAAAAAAWAHGGWCTAAGTAGHLQPQVELAAGLYCLLLFHWAVLLAVPRPYTQNVVTKRMFYGGRLRQHCYKISKVYCI